MKAPSLIFDTESHFHPSSVELLPIISVLVYIFSLSCSFSSPSHYNVKISFVKEHKIQLRQNSNTDKNTVLFPLLCVSLSNKTPFLCSLILVSSCGPSLNHSPFFYIFCISSVRQKQCCRWLQTIHYRILDF